jgi:putative ABC transport system permease protein
MNMSLVLTLASRNLFQDRLRFVATLVGIVFSVVLVMVQMGLYLGFGRMVTTMIDHAAADLWVVSKGASSFEDLTLLDIRTRDRLPGISDVAEVIPVVIGFADWRRQADGRVKPVFVIGSGLNAGALVPWNLVEGNVDALRASNAVAVDKTYFGDLGVSGVGSTAEFRSQPATVGAITDGIRSFTTTPYVFADLGRARAYIGLSPTKFNHFMIRLQPGANANSVQHDIQAAVPDADVLTPAQFRDRSRSFWLFGAGAALFAGALLGVIVGTVIVAQTLYSSTKDHLYEFATLRAIGCSNRYIYRVIIWQALLNAVIGFALATAIGYVVVLVTAKSALPIVITPALIGGLCVLTIVMCVGSAVTAIIRVVRIDPVMVMSR